MLARRVKGEIGPFKHRRLSCPAGRPIDERVTFRIETLLPIVNDDYDGKKKKKRKRKRRSREESHDTIYRHIALIREEECTVARVRKGGNSVRSGERRQTMLQCAFNIHAHTQSRLCAWALLVVER